MNQTPTRSETVKAPPSAVSQLTPSQMQTSAEMRAQGAARLRDELSSNPWYAEQAAKEEAATGDPLAYWKCLFSSQVNRYRKD